MLCTGRDVEASVRQVSSACERMQTAAATIRTAQRDRVSAMETDSSATRLSDQLGESVELAISELLSAVRHLCTTLVSKLA